MATLKADMKRDFSSDLMPFITLQTKTPALTPVKFEQQNRPLGILSLAIKQSF